MTLAVTANHLSSGSVRRHPNRADWELATVVTPVRFRPDASAPIAPHLSAGIQPGHTKCLAEPAKEVLLDEAGLPFQSYSFVEVSRRIDSSSSAPTLRAGSVLLNQAGGADPARPLATVAAPGRRLVSVMATSLSTAAFEGRSLAALRACRQ